MTFWSKYGNLIIGSILIPLIAWALITLNAVRNDQIIIKDTLTKVQSDINDIRTQGGRVDELIDQDEKKISYIEGKLGLNDK